MIASKTQKDKENNTSVSLEVRKAMRENISKIYGFNKVSDLPYRKN